MNKVLLITIKMPELSTSRHTHIKTRKVYEYFMKREITSYLSLGKYLPIAHACRHSVLEKLLKTSNDSTAKEIHTVHYELQFLSGKKGECFFCRKKIADLKNSKNTRSSARPQKSQKSEIGLTIVQHLIMNSTYSLKH
jgi:hypothetical protein